MCFTFHVKGQTGGEFNVMFSDEALVLSLYFSYGNRTRYSDCFCLCDVELFPCSTDASQDDGSLGRLVNDNHINPNCKIKKIFCDGKPHLCLFAVTEISPGEEITYSYGNGSYPWRSMVSLFIKWRCFSSFLWSDLLYSYNVMVSDVRAL